MTKKMASKGRAGRTVYVLARPTPDSTRPQVTIDQLKGGEITFGVRVAARSLAKARELAVVEFEALRAFAQTIEDQRLEATLRKSVGALAELAEADPSLLLRKSL